MSGARKQARDAWQTPDPRNAQGGITFVRPSLREQAIYGTKRAASCADCGHFDHRAGQEHLFRRKGLATIVHDYQWQRRHLCTDPEHMGLCNARGSLTGPTYPPCADFRGRR